jgi:proline iminopeptidase
VSRAARSCLALLAVGFGPGRAAAQSGRPLRGPPGIPLVAVGRAPPTVVVLHGGPATTHRYLRPEWDRLRAVGRVVYYDQRGCGASERTDSVTWRTHVADLDRIVESARADGPVLLAGSSWGAILALLYAHQHPGRVRGLLLTGIPAVANRVFRMPGGRARPPEGELQRAIDISWRRWIRKAGLAWPAVVDSAEVARGIGWPHPELAARAGMSCPRAAARTNRSVLETGPALGALAALDLPVLIVRGTEEAPVGDGSELVAAVLPRARVVTLPGAAHDPWFERPDAFFAEARAFIAWALRAGGPSPESTGIPASDSAGRNERERE